jgi:LAS superfamily LD-carboxypeptidase LdcB
MRIFLFLFCSLICLNCSPSENTGGQQSIEEPARVNPRDTFSYDYTISYIMGQFEPAEHPDFVPVEVKYADRGGMYLHKDTYAAFLRMHAAAAADGVNLVVRSATRNFNSQKGIWEAKWNGTRKIENGKDASKAYPNPVDRALKILEYSSMPGSSRHHWGTDIDLNNFTNEWFETGEGKKIYDWLQTHAAKYGFCQPYSPKGAERPNGYNEERWHWSYLPLSLPLTDLASVELKDEMIEGFLGSETALEIGVVEKYVLGINRDCQP